MKVKAGVDVNQIVLIVLPKDEVLQRKEKNPLDQRTTVGGKIKIEGKGLIATTIVIVVITKTIVTIICVNTDMSGDTDLIMMQLDIYVCNLFI